MKKNTNPIDREEIADRNREVLLICLDRFVSHGLMDTSVRDLSRSIKLQGAGITVLQEQRRSDSLVRGRGCKPACK